MKQEINEQVVEIKKQKKENNKRTLIIILGALIFLLMIAVLLYNFVLKREDNNDNKEKSKFENVYGVRIKWVPNIISSDRDFSIYALMEDGKEELVFENCIDKIKQIGGTEISNKRVGVIGYEYINDVLYIYYEGKVDEKLNVNSILVYSIDFNESELTLKKEYDFDINPINNVKASQVGDLIYYTGYEILGSYDKHSVTKIYKFNKLTKQTEMVYDFDEHRAIHEMIGTENGLYLFDIGNSEKSQSTSYFDLINNSENIVADKVIVHSYDPITKNAIYTTRKGDMDILNVFDMETATNKEISTASTVGSIMGISCDNNLVWVSRNDNVLHINGKNNHTIDLKEYILEKVEWMNYYFINKYEVVLNVGFGYYSGDNNKYYKVNVKTGEINSLESIELYEDSYILLEK